MKLYRIHMTTNGGSSAGYEFVSSQAAASKAVHAYKRANPGEEALFDVIEVMPTRTGILMALNLYADHPNNG